MTMTMAVTEKSEWQAGWRPLIAGFMGLATGWNVANVMAGLFLKPMQADFGWSRTELSFAPMASLIVALMLPFLAPAVDRLGARLIAIAGMISLALAFLLFSLVPAERTIFFLCTIWLGIAGALSSSIIFARGVSAWFSVNLGTAVGLMMTGASVAAALGMPLIGGLIEEQGWRIGFRALALVVLLIGLPVVLLWFREPAASERAGAIDDRPRDSMRTILRTPNFWKLGIASAIAALPIGGFIGHLVPLLTDQGMAAAAAAGMASVFAIAVGFGRIANGLLLDRINPSIVTFLTLTLAAIGSAALWFFGAPAIPWVMLAFIIGLIGVAQGAEGDYIKFFSMRLFGFANFARVVALMATTISLFMALGGIIFAIIFDYYGSYQPAVAASILLYALGGLVFLTIRIAPAGGQSGG